MARVPRSSLPDGIYHVTTRGVDRCTVYHLVVETLQPLLSAGMHRVNGRHAEEVNRKYGRTGHLFGDRFGVRVVEDEEYLAEVCRYVVNNPVRAGLCASPADWPWNACRYGLDL